MIKKFTFNNFKGFQEFTLSFDRINLLIGGNNSGKTTVFHALQILFWCLEKTASKEGENVNIRKTQLPEIGLIPYFNLRDLFYMQKVRIRRKPTRILLELETTVAPKISFDIYPSFGRNVMIDGKNIVMTKQQYQNLLELKPIYIPGTIGIITQEELYREIAQERLVGEGRHNQVLRNMIYRLKQKKLLGEFCRLVKPLFSLTDITIPFDENKDEWLTAIYEEDGCKFDFVSAGSGFLQVSNIVAFLLLHPSKVTLLDEPDSHLHDDLLRIIFSVLKDLAEAKRSQLIISTHNSTLIDSAGIGSLMLIDKKEKKPLRPKDVDNLIPMLADRGLSLPPRKIMNTLIGRKILFVEGKESDYESFIKILGTKLNSNFMNITRTLTLFESEGATKQWPFDTIRGFEKLLGTNIKYIYLGDSDFNTDAELTKKKERATSEKHNICFLQRRNRESYLIDPKIISRLLVEKWRRKKPRGRIPAGMRPSDIKAFIVAKAKEWEADIQAKYVVFHDTRGSESERQRKISTLNKFFKEKYSDVCNKNEIPYRLLDSKQVLKRLREFIVGKFKMSFTDDEIAYEYQKSEIPTDIKKIVQNILTMFGK